MTNDKMPIAQGGAGGQAPANPDDRRMDEWKECRKSIERFDKTIVDLRKYGFTLVTGLITASAYFFAKSETLNIEKKAAVSFVTIVLIFALYIIDRCHENFLRGAVARAEEIEKQLGMGLSVRISAYSARAQTDTHGQRLYGWFVVAAAIPLFATVDTTKDGWEKLVTIFGAGVFFFLGSIRERYEIARRKADSSENKLIKTLLPIVGLGKWGAVASLAVAMIHNYSFKSPFSYVLIGYGALMAIALLILALKNK